MEAASFTGGGCLRDWLGACSFAVVSPRSYLPFGRYRSSQFSGAGPLAPYIVSVLPVASARRAVARPELSHLCLPPVGWARSYTMPLLRVVVAPNLPPFASFGALLWLIAPLPVRALRASARLISCMTG